MVDDGFSMQMTVVVSTLVALIAQNPYQMRWIALLTNGLIHGSLNSEYHSTQRSLQM